MTDDSRRRYTKRELQNLWASGFDGVDDEAERLAGFADCPTEQAEAMIESFRKTAAAQKAAEAEANRKKPRKEKAPPVETEEITEVSEPFPATDIVAAAVNASHGFSVVEASGMSRDRRRSIIVERITHHGEYFHRIKVTYFTYYKTKNQAIEAAQKHKLKLTVFDP